MQTEAQRRAKNKYDAKKYIVLSAKMKKETVEAFRAYAAAHETTVNALLSEFVAGCLADFQPSAVPAPADDQPEKTE